VKSRIKVRLEAAKAGDHLRGAPLNPPTDKERQLVIGLRLVQIPYAIIAERLGISEKALKTHYRAELDAGGDDANASVAAALYKRAIDPTQPAQAAIFWLKCRAGWKEEDVRNAQAQVSEVRYVWSSREKSITSPSSVSPDFTISDADSKDTAVQ